MDKNPHIPILLVDDEEKACNYYRSALKTAFINNVIYCRDSREVMPLLETGDFKVIILDLLMPYLSGKELLSRIIKDFPHIPVIMLTAVDELETAVDCMKTGAFDYIVKPVEKNRLISSIKRAIELRELREENLSLKESLMSMDLKDKEAFSPIITQDPSMHSLFLYMESIARTSRPVLVTGETGTGKEQIARVLHQLSGKEGELITVNIAGLEDNIFSDTLFGHTKGAFTGAAVERKGLIQQAEGGTLFLDEIGDLEKQSQIKLLRLIQEGEYYPLGSDIKKLSNARIIVATNRNLEKLMDEDLFRKDLYYRLCDHRIHVPPLRDRKGDLPLLIDHFLTKAAKTLKKKKPSLPEENLNLLSQYHFPGNIRELESLIFDAVSTHKKGILSLQNFRKIIGSRTGAPHEKAMEISGGGEVFQPEFILKISQAFPTIREIERELIKEALKRTKGNQSIAARMLGISRPTLSNRIKECKENEK